MPSKDKEGALQIGEWIVNPSLDSISKGTETQKLEPRTMRLLLCLAGSAGEVVHAVIGPASLQLRARAVFTPQLAQEWAADNADCRVIFHNWWNAPRTWAKVQAIDPKQLTETESVSGAYLMHHGLNLNLRGDYDSTSVILEKQ